MRHYPIHIITRSLYTLCLFLCAAAFSGCESFLDESPDKKLALPNTLEDLQALLDNFRQLNQNDPSGSAEASADNYYLPAATWSAMSNEAERRKYIWEKDRLFGIGYRPNDWYTAYQIIYYANTVLEGLQGIPRTPANAATWDNVQGQAAYYRGHALLSAASTWTLAYDAQTASRELGLPLRLTTDFNEQIARASLQQTYDQLLQDLHLAATHLPASVPHVMRPSQAAAFGQLARAYLAMRRYEEAGEYAAKSLALQDKLLDYNLLSPSASYPFPRFHVEVLHESTFGPGQALSNSRARIDTLLYQSYEEQDLRKSLYFKETADGSYSFKGSYAGGSSLFAGVATDEMYLILAESRARAGDVTGALEPLNTLLRHRYQAGTFTALAAVDAAEALALVLRERRKELLLRGLRWSDIKRLNKEGANISLTRVLDTETYVLPPGDPRFALPLPEDVIELSGMQQNPR